MNNQRRDILLRFGIVYVLILLAFLLVLVKIVNIQFVHRSYWLSYLKIPPLSSPMRADSIVPATRGNIYSCDGKLLAGTIPRYHLYWDTRYPALKKVLPNKKGKHEHTAPLFYETVDSLSISLSKLFKDKSPAEYRRNLVDAFKRGDSRYSIVSMPVSYFDLQKVKTFPLFRLGQMRSGLSEEEYSSREHPFGDMASRTIGSIRGVEEKDSIKEDDRWKTKIYPQGSGRSGLEMQFDSLLSGKPGVKSQQRFAGQWEDVIETPPEDGADIITTLDVGIQDIAENALLRGLITFGAMEGCAIVMETQTGEIKAVANLGKNPNGSYSEIRNYAFADELEPGSTFKVASIMAAIDDGQASENDTVDTGNGRYFFPHYDKPMTDYKSGGFHRISVAQAIWYSSNIGVSRTVYTHYHDNPAAFIDKLYQMKLNQPIPFDIPGAGEPYISHPGNKGWDSKSWMWMSIGYGVKIPPVYTLTFYNAIANNGKMIRPFLVKSISREGKTVNTFTTETINDAICKPSTLEKIKAMLEGVVQNPKGTGKSVQSPYVAIAGKSGTAQISNGKAGYKVNGTVLHQVSFCGYFPADNPHYTALCVMRQPTIGGASGGHQAGSVVKEIAELVYASKMTHQPKDIARNLPKTPKIKGGNYNDVSKALSGLSLSFTGDKSKNSLVRVSADSATIWLKPMSYSKNGVPDVVGLGAKDAVYLLENAGLRVAVQGRGKVVSQSLAAGSPPQRGQVISLMLQ